MPGTRRPATWSSRGSRAGGRTTGSFRPFPATGKEWALPICELWHFGPDGRVVGGEIYYDQASLLTQLGLLPEPARV